jgi:mRNA interferase MazF
MPSTTIYKQGDVLLVPFPFTDQSAVKQRPAVVLSGEAYNRSHHDVILAPITSQSSSAADEVSLLHWKKAGLLKSSVVKPVLSSFETTLIKRRLGALSHKDLKAVRDLFRRILEFQAR